MYFTQLWKYSCLYKKKEKKMFCHAKPNQYTYFGAKPAVSCNGVDLSNTVVTTTGTDIGSIFFSTF